MLSSVSTTCVGIDIFSAGVAKLQSDGYDARVADAQQFDLPEKDFDVAILGDVIEHVGSPGCVLQCVRRHLTSDGEILVTTPNPFSIDLTLQVLLRNRYYVNREHVVWFDPVLLSFLLEREGFRTEELIWSGVSSRRLFRWAQSLRPNFHDTFGLRARKQ
jgi:SAM-dependent methyltransferase